MTPAELSAIKERANNATPGPWEPSESVDETEFGAYVAYGVAPIAPLEWYFDSDPAHTALDVMDKADAEFIAHARTDIPALLDLVDKINESANDFAQAATSLSADNVRLGDRLNAVRELHRSVGRGLCATCSTDGTFVQYPCPTIQAIDGD